VIVRAVIAGIVAGLSLGLAMLWRRREGRFTQGTGRFDRGELGLTRRDHPSALLVEFFGEDCAPCTIVESRIGKIAEEVPGVSVVSIDAGARLDVAERHEVRRVPTLFVLDEELKVIWRASGVPSEDSIRTALLGPDWAGRPHPDVSQQQRVAH
jgi:thiol-disulfide isomerase/thioredoxin